MVLMINVSDDPKELGIAVDATAVLRRTPAFTGEAARIAAVVIGRLEALVRRIRADATTSPDDCVAGLHGSVSRRCRMAALGQKTINAAVNEP